MAKVVFGEVKLRQKGFFGFEWKKFTAEVHIDSKTLNVFNKAGASKFKFQIIYHDIVQPSSQENIKKQNTFDLLGKDNNNNNKDVCFTLWNEKNMSDKVIDAIQVSLKPAAAVIEMPAPDVVNELFESVLDLLAIPDAKRAQTILGTDIKTRWQMIQMHNISVPNESKVEQEAKEWAELLNEQRSITLKEAKDLEFAMRCANKLFLKSFFDEDGLEGIVSQLEKLALNKGNSSMNSISMALHLVQVVRQCMTVGFGVEQLLDTSNAVESLVNILDLDLLANRPLTELVLKLLSALCFFERDDSERSDVDPDQGHKDVMDAFRRFSQIQNEVAPFHSLVSALRRSLRPFGEKQEQEKKTEERESHVVIIDFQLDLIKLINEMINRCERIEERIPLRDEFQRVQLWQVLTELRDSYESHEKQRPDALLDAAEEKQYQDYVGKVKSFLTQIQVFEQMVMADNEDRRATEAGDTFDVQVIYDRLVTDSERAGDVPRLLNVLHHLTFIPNDLSFGPKVWEVLQKVVHTITTLPSSQQIQEWRFDVSELDKLGQEFRTISENLTGASGYQEIIDNLKIKCKKLQEGLCTDNTNTVYVLIEMHYLYLNSLSL